MTKSPEEIIKEIEDCKTIEQINKLYEFYFKMYMAPETTNVSFVELLVEKSQIQIIFDFLVLKEDEILREIAVNN